MATESDNSAKLPVESSENGQLLCQAIEDIKQFEAGTEVSLLDIETKQAIKYIQKGLCTKRFRADILTTGIDYAALNIGDRFIVGGQNFVVTRKKGCHEECELRKSGEYCPLRNGALFAYIEETKK